MAGPAHRNAAGPDGPAAGRPGPGVLRALVTEAAACRLAVEEIARRPGDRAALEMARRTLSVLEYLRDETARQLDFGPEVIAEAIARAVEQDRAARAPRRGGGPRAHLHRVI